MAPFEALYGCRCRTPLNWSEPGERWFFGVDLVKQTEEKVRQIQNNLKVSQSRQKSYADKRRRPLVFQVGDYVHLKVSPMKGVSRFGVKGKLAPRYIGPFQIIQQCGKVAYKLKLPEQLSAVHNVFHVSQMNKCLQVHDHVVDVEGVELEPDLTYSEHPTRVLDQKIVLPEVEQLNGTEYNGINIQKRKPLGNRRITCWRISLSSLLLSRLQFLL
jgi:hypothetical protein